MSRDYITDYTTACYRLHARVGGLERYEQVKKAELIKLEAWNRTDENGFTQKGFSDPTASAVRRANSDMQEDGLLGEMRDLKAVHEALKIIGRMGSIENEVLKCLEAVYYPYPDQDIEKGEISLRIIHAARDHHLGERTVYRRLALARALCARERGLRLDDKHWRVIKSHHLENVGSTTT